MSGGGDRKRRRPGRRLLIGLVSLFVVIQLVPYGRDHVNPPPDGEPSWDRPETRALFMEVCADCHSHLTKWPWYSHIAPASWLVQSDVEEGRRHFNISRPGKRRDKGHEAAGEVREGIMPILAYRLMHPEARLDPARRAALIAGLEATFGGNPGHGADPGHGGDAGHGGNGAD